MAAVSAQPYCPANLAIAVIAIGSALLGWTWLARPRSRAVYVVVALPMLLLCLGWVVLVGATGSAGTAWGGRKTERLLLRDLDSPAAKIRDGAAAELLRRLAGGQLSVDRQRELIDRVLDRQADLNTPWNPALGQLVESAHAAGMTTPQQWQR